MHVIAHWFTSSQQQDRHKRDGNKRREKKKKAVQVCFYGLLIVWVILYNRGRCLLKKKKHFHAVLFHLQEKNLFRTTTTTTNKLKKLWCGTTNCVRTRRRLAVCAKGSYVHHNEGVIQMNQLFQGYISTMLDTRKRNWDIMEASLKPSCVFPHQGSVRSTDAIHCHINNVSPVLSNKSFLVRYIFFLNRREKEFVAI